MNSYDVNSRLQRVYSSFGKKYEQTPSTAHTQSVTTKHDDGTLEIRTTFHSKSLDERLNIINTILYNIANLKDAFKAEFSVRGLDNGIVESELSSILEINVLLDLVNQEKHGYPLTKYKHSKLDPKLANIKEGLAFNALGLRTGGRVKEQQNGNLEMDGDVGLEILCDVVDLDDKVLFSLDSMINASIRFFEELKKRYLE
jgi:hypothetical protein